MERRDVLRISVGAIVASTIDARAFGQGVSARVDDAAGRQYDRERRFAETAFGRIAYVDRRSKSPLFHVGARAALDPALRHCDASKAVVQDR